MTDASVVRPLPTLQARVEIAASSDSVWRIVSDVRRTGEWSTECRRVVPVGRVRRGTWMMGYNRRGGVRWATLSRITSAEPGEEIAWRVVTNGSIWSYRIDPEQQGCILIHSRESPYGIKKFANWFLRKFLGGQATHDEELLAGMQAGLQRIKTIAEK